MVGWMSYEPSWMKVVIFTKNVVIVTLKFVHLGHKGILITAGPQRIWNPVAGHRADPLAQATARFAASGFVDESGAVRFVPRMWKC